ncbi:hypothetical protein [Anatilimnocola floriformis]|uniref:hypothetical protein n=1 Tax=Anatilimnocola floriformis TaxID=2948575 RepID=UPI0020C5A187|nr:hypothetical protein [Anatilimnocola floriformis]
MSRQFSTEQAAILKDLLKEKTLFALYRNSLKIPFSRFNFWISCVGGLSAFVASLWTVKCTDLLDSLSAISVIGISSSISLLGFLLAGFSFFASVSDRLLFCRMAELHHECGLSYLKYNFLVFMRVFVEYLVFSVVSLLVLVLLQKGTPFREQCGPLFDAWLWPNWVSLPVLPGTILGALLMSSYVGFFLFLLLQLKSFIFNIYHVVMTNIRWALETEYLERGSETGDTNKE